MEKTVGDGNLMASNLLRPIQLQKGRRTAMSPGQGWETWCLHTVPKWDYLPPVVEGTEDSTDSHCQAWLREAAGVWLPGAALVKERHTKSCLFSLPKVSAAIVEAGQQSRL